MLRVVPFLLLATSASAADWDGWRGPDQLGVAHEAGVSSTFSPDDASLIWSTDLHGRGTPVVHGGHLYAWGYRGEKTSVREVLAAFDLASGALLWEHEQRDFLSDTVYDRYSIGAPAVDPATGDVFVLTSAGVVAAFSPDGVQRWEVSMMDAWGRMTFPNGRIGAPIVVDDLVIVHGITASWGAQGPARDRFYAFDTATGEAVWVSTPGIGPKDSSFSTPFVETRGGRRVLYAGTGCGEVVAVDVATGDPIWRFPIARGGVDVSPVVSGDRLVIGHDKENLASTKTGGMVALDLTKPTEDPGDGTAPVLVDAVVWRSDVVAGSSSAVLDDGIVYQVQPSGELTALDLVDGTKLWSVSLGPDQLHASPLLADGKLFVPLRDGTLHVVEAGRRGGRILRTVQLAGSALGSPAIVDGRLIVHTTAKLYVFDVAPKIAGAAPIAVTGHVVAPQPITIGPATRLRVHPAEVLLRPGERVALTADVLDDHGNVLRSRVPVEAAEPWIPPTAKVRSTMDAHFEAGALVAAPDASLSAGAWKVSAAGLQGTTRGRTVAGVPYSDDLDSYPLTEASSAGSYGWPPLPWIGARFKWELRERDGSHVLAKTIENPLFQRAITFLGHPDEHDYGIQADVMSDGTARQMSAVGVIDSRYLIALKGNQRALEISSNQERLKESVPFVAEPGVWYRLRAEVIPQPDHSTIVRAKAWKRTDPEPDAWTISIRHADGHTHGAPGIYGFTPGNVHKVYVDDIRLTPVREAR